MFDLVNSTSLLTQPSTEEMAAYPYLYYGVNPNYPITTSLVSLNKWKKVYVAERFDIEKSSFVLSHDIVHAILGQMGLIPYDDFQVIEDLVTDVKHLNVSGGITSGVRSFIGMSGNEDSAELSSKFLEGYLSNPHKIPLLGKTLNRLFGKDVTGSDSLAKDLLSIYPELIEPICFYYECINIDPDLLQTVRYCFDELYKRNDVVIIGGTLSKPKELRVVQTDRGDTSDIESQREFKLKEKAAIDAWNGIEKTIKNIKIDNPEINEKILRYSVRNMTVLFEMPADFIANYFDITLEQVNQYIREDSFCQRLPQIKETLESLDPERFKEFKEGSY